MNSVGPFCYDYKNITRKHPQRIGDVWGFYFGGALSNTSCKNELSNGFGVKSSRVPYPRDPSIQIL